jgi:hypothetical protein
MTCLDTLAGWIIGWHHPRVQQQLREHPAAREHHRGRGLVHELRKIIANCIQVHIQDQATRDTRSSSENKCQARDASIGTIQKINSVTGMLVLSAPASINMQLGLLSSSHVAKNADFAGLEYTRQDIVMQVIAAALITRGYHGYSAELIADVVKHLAREAREQCHRTCIGHLNQIDSATLKELGFGTESNPHEWTYAHLCYIELVLDVEIYILGHEYSINFPADQQELAAHVKTGWWGKNATMLAHKSGKDLKWHRLTHTSRDDHTTPQSSRHDSCPGAKV